MKKLCLVIIMVLTLASLAYAQSVSTAELKSVLIDSIKDYLSSQTPNLEKAELKDLIVVYLSTKGDTADLSGIGPFSGKKFIDVYNKAKGTASQTCTSVGGTCKPNACNTYVDCVDLSSGQCDSGNCCSGSCAPTGIPLPLNDRIAPTIPGGTERVYTLHVESNDKVYLRIDFTAFTNEALAYITWTMPDGTESILGRVEGTSIGAGFALRSKKYYWPQYANINSDYIPSGYYIIRIRAVNTSYLIIRTTLD